ncbi:hypothetical protein [Pseudomonas sp. TWR1-1-4]|uniref:hypothetical protein n=1 Tax=Pseudomonas sp. TWR1-1-4 TaxID=2804604 RepID=UPI003CF62C20
MQAPTDNLYKFLSIVGMICFVFFFFDLNKRSDDLELKIDSLTIQQVEFLATLDAIKTDSNRLSKVIANLNSGTTTLKDLMVAMPSLEATRDKIQSRFDEAKLVNAKLNANLELVKSYFEKLKNLAYLYGWLQCVSLIVAFVGMLLWYYRTQRYLDLKDKQSVI